MRPFSKKSVSPSFARVKSPHITLNDGDNTPSSAPNYSTTNHQISTIQRLHIINNTLINQSRKFSVLSAVCVPSSQRRHHTIEIMHIHRTSLVLLGTMMPSEPSPAATTIANIHYLMAAAARLPFAHFFNRFHRDLCLEMSAFGDGFRGKFGSDNQQ